MFFVQLLCNRLPHSLVIAVHCLEPQMILCFTGSGGPFRATRLWNDIISHLKEHVEVKRRRVKMRSYDHCFTGTDAVDVVLERLHAERLNFAKEVSRDKACKVSIFNFQKFYENSIALIDGQLYFASLYVT